LQITYLPRIKDDVIAMFSKKGKSASAGLCWRSQKRMYQPRTNHAKLDPEWMADTMAETNPKICSRANKLIFPIAEATQGCHWQQISGKDDRQPEQTCREREQIHTEPLAEKLRQLVSDPEDESHQDLFLTFCP
jgi:hypothetical protein